MGSFGKKWGLFQKIGTFAFSPDRAFPKNRDFHRNSLHMRVPILSKPVYLAYEPNKVGCIFPMVVISILLHAEFGPNDHREEALL